jgi:hypothetical protein
MSKRSQLINESQIVKKWSPIVEEATGITDKSKLKWMSVYSHFHSVNENQNALLTNVPGMGATALPGDPVSNYGFSGQAKGSGDKPYSLLPLSMQVAAQTVGLDMVPVVPMDGPLGILTYVDYMYANGKFNTNQRPKVLKANIAGTHVLYNTYEVQDTTATNAKVMELTFIGVSRLDGYKIFQVGAAEAAYSNITMNDIFVVGGTDYAITTETTPVAINVAPEFVKALEDHLTGYSNGNNYQSNSPMSREVGETTDYNMMGLKFFNKSVEAETYKVGIALTREQIQDSRQFGFDIIAQGNAVIANELTQSMNKLILGRIFEMGTENAKDVFNTTGTNLNLNLSATNNLATDLGNDKDGNNVTFGNLDAFTATTGENLSTIQRRILGRLIAVSNFIGNRGRRGPGDMAVMNANLASALQDISGFVPAPMNNTIAQSAGSIYPLGSLAGINIFVDPDMTWDDTRVTVFRKGDGNTPGLVLMPYLMAESIDIIAEGTMAPKMVAMSRLKLVDAGHNPELYYFTFKVHVPTSGII